MRACTRDGECNVAFERPLWCTRQGVDEPDGVRARDRKKGGGGSECRGRGTGERLVLKGSTKKGNLTKENTERVRESRKEKEVRRER